MSSVRSAIRRDAPAWLRMREALWPEGDSASHAGEIEQYFAGKLRMPLEVLLVVDDSGTAVGFAELSIRSYRQGLGRALVAAAEKWALAQGCTEFGSDALIDNDASAAAHLALGFVETVQIRCFGKPLGES